MNENIQPFDNNKAVSIFFATAWKINIEHVLMEVWLEDHVPFFPWLMAVGSSRSSSRVDPGKHRWPSMTSPEKIQLPKSSKWNSRHSLEKFTEGQAPGRESGQIGSYQAPLTRGSYKWRVRPQPC